MCTCTHVWLVNSNILYYLVYNFVVPVSLLFFFFHSSCILFPSQLDPPSYDDLSSSRPVTNSRPPVVTAANLGQSLRSGSVGSESSLPQEQEGVELTGIIFNQINLMISHR